MDVAETNKQTSVQKHASCTVMHTYVVLMTMDKVPAIASIAGRKKAIQDMKERLGPRFFNDSKNKVLSKSLVVRANELGEGKVRSTTNWWVSVC